MRRNVELHLCHGNKTTLVCVGLADRHGHISLLGWEIESVLVAHLMWFSCMFFLVNIFARCVMCDNMYFHDIIYT